MSPSQFSAFAGTEQDPLRDDLVTFTVELPPGKAYALAELCKRITWSDCSSLSVGEEQTRAMIGATDAVRAALARAGVRVR